MCCLASVICSSAVESYYIVFPKIETVPGLAFNKDLLGPHQSIGKAGLDSPDGMYRGRKVFMRDSSESGYIPVAGSGGSSGVSTTHREIIIAMGCKTKLVLQVLALAAIGSKSKFKGESIQIPNDAKALMMSVKSIKASDPEAIMSLLRDEQVCNSIQNLFSQFGAEELTCQKGLLSCTARSGLELVAGKDNCVMAWRICFFLLSA